MKIWRKDFTKNLKDDKKAKEEFTDISTASTPKQEQKKDKMEEIYSTKDKQIKYKRLTPLEAEEAAKRREEAKEKLDSGEAELVLNDNKENEPIVELTSEFEEGTVIAEDIIEDVEHFDTKRRIELEDINEIDIPIDPTQTLKKYERQINSTARHDERVNSTSTSAYEQLFGKPKYYVQSEKVVAKIPTYHHESKIHCVHLKAGRFTNVVKNEYDEYLKSNAVVSSKKPSSEISQKPSLLFTLSQMANIRNAQKSKASQSSAITPDNEKPKKKAGYLHKIKKFFKITYRLIFSKSAKEAENKKSDTKSKTVDYQERQDLTFVGNEISQNFKKTSLKTILLALLFVFSLSLTIMEKTAGKSMFSGLPYTPLIYCAINLILLLLVGVVCNPYILSGLKPLKNFKGNSDTAIAVAYIACLAQQILSLFIPGAFVESDYHLYTTVLIMGFSLNAIGKLIMTYRVKANFKFITSKAPAYSAKVYNDEETARKMLSGTTASHSVIAYQHKTDFLSDFIKISYAPDPSEEFSGKLAPITLVSSVFVSIVYGIIFKSFIGALSALAVMCCISIPVSALLTGNIPLLISCKDSLKHSAMLSGYPSIRQFSDCDAVMVNASKLYPKGSININNIKYFAEFRIEEAMISAALVMKEAKSPLYYAFSDMVKKTTLSLPKVESVMYEDKLGLVGWVNGERILVGNRKLLDRFHIYIEDAADETKYKNMNKEVTYIACSGQLIALVVSTYSPDKTIKKELYRAQKNGLCLVVSTTDSNITADKIATDYEIFPRTIKVLNTGFATTCNEVCSKKSESERAYLATKGSFASLIHAVTNAISFRQNLTIGLIVQIFGLLLGVLLCATMVLYASVSILGVIEILLYIIFWGIASVISQLINKP